VYNDANGVASADDDGMVHVLLLVALAVMLPLALLAPFMLCLLVVPLMQRSKCLEQLDLFAFINCLPWTRWPYGSSDCQPQ